MKHVFVLTCFLFVLFIDHSDQANAYCYGYPANWLKCGNLVDSSRQCMCKTNCAPVLQVCKQYGTYVDWAFNGRPCFAQEFYNQVVPERNDTSLLISYVGANYTVTCKKGYKMRETMEQIEVSCKSGDLTIKPQTLQCDRVTCSSDPPETLRCLEREVLSLNATTNNVTYYGEKRSCTCRNNCRNVTVTCGEVGEWEYDTAQCSDENKAQAYQHYILWYLNGNYTVICEPVLATERHTMLLLSTSEIVLILALCLVSLALLCVLVVTYLRRCKKHPPVSETFVIYTKSQTSSLRSNMITDPAAPTLKTEHCMIDNDLYISNEFTPKDFAQEDYYSNISEVVYENHDSFRQN
ncbi:hypothetical protein B566_EDAN005836 [Ephemera danica]|nr:hypothetical protein B566_EDAN005836 [Ephemera danica]